MNNFDFIFKRAIFSNISAVNKYFINNPSNLKNVVRAADETVSEYTVWKHEPTEGEYIFSGYSRATLDRYSLNIETGLMMKNGR